MAHKDEQQEGHDNAGACSFSTDPKQTTGDRSSMIEQRPTVQDDMPNSGHYKNNREGIVCRHPHMTAERHLLHLQQMVRQTGHWKPQTAECSQ